MTRTPDGAGGEPDHNRPDRPSYSQVAVEHQAPLQAWSDEALMAAYQRGDATAFETLFGRYKDRIYGYLVRRFNDREAAEDLFQSTFLRVHRARRDYDTTRPFATWIFAIASNLGRDELKRRARRPGDVHWEALDDAPARTSSEIDPERRLLSREQAARTETALAALPDSQREVIVLHKLEGLSFPEIAEVLGETAEAVKSRAFRGYRALRRLLGGHEGDGLL